MSDHYKIIFEGKILPGKDIDSVKKNLMDLLNQDETVMDRLFSGKPMVIRKNADAKMAEKFRKAFEIAGAICTINPVEGSGNGSDANSTDRFEAKPNAHQKQSVKPVSTRTFKSSNGGNLIVTNIESVPGKSIVEHFGLVSGNTIRAKHIGRDIMAGLKNLVGGELKGYTQLLQESRQQALERMIEEADQLGANAIINVRFSTSSVAQGAAELYAYGTAVSVVD
jgi:uncharacterized protein YbjQ (UPF0145 family)